VSILARVTNGDVPPAQVDGVDEQLVGQLVEQARAKGLQLSGEGGLLQQLTKRVLESAMEGEITDHLGYDKHDRAGRGGGNSRNGTRSKTVLTEVGPVPIDVPRRCGGHGAVPVGQGQTTGEISAHLEEVYGAQVSKQTICTITDKVLEGMAEWQNRPLDPVHPVIFLDAVHVKIRDGKVANRPDLRRPRGHRGRHPRHPGPVGRRRRSGRHVLVRRAHRAA
jgi:putative transposase